MLINNLPPVSIPARIAHVSSFDEVILYDSFRNSATISIGQITVRRRVLFVKFEAGFAAC